MKRPLKPLAPRTLVNLRRRVLPLAATAAALGLTGCGMLGAPAAHSDPAAGADPATTTITAQSTRAQVQAFTAGLDEAIAKLDRDKLRPAAQKPAEPAEPVTADPPKTPDVAQVTPPARPAITPVNAPAAPLKTPAALPAKLELRLDGAAPVLTLASAAPTPPAEFTLSTPITTQWTDPLPPPRAITSEPAAPIPQPPPAETPDPAADPTLDALHARVAAHPTLTTALALALLQSSDAKTPDPAIAAKLSANDQKILQDLLTALNAVGPSTAAVTLPERAAPLVEAAKKWQADADLVLPKLALASRVDSYGVYTKLDPKFPAGKKQTVIIYCEVANFSPKKTADDWFETRLSQQETLATDDGLLLWRPNAEEVEDRSKNQRRDFYLVKKLTIPDNLAVGKYALRMSVTDRNTGKIAVVSLPIEIVK